MKKRTQRILILAGLALLTAIVVFQLRAKTMLDNFLDRKLPKNISLVYADVSINVLTGCLELSDVQIELRSIDNNSLRASASVKSLRLAGLGHLKFVFNNTIHADRFEFISPHFLVYPDIASGKTPEDHSSLLPLKRIISMNQFSVLQGTFDLVRSDSNSTSVTVELFDLRIDGPRTDPEIVLEDIPFHFEDYSLAFGHTEVGINAFEELLFDSLTLEDDDALLSGLSIHSLNSRSTLSRIAEQEREYVSIAAPTLAMNDLDFGFKDHRFYLTSNALNIDRPQLDIYLDKLLPDRQAHKILYSRYLRELNIDLGIDSVRVSKGLLTYTELIEEGVQPGEITVSSFDLYMSGINNSQDYDGMTKVALRGQLLEKTPLELEVEFKIQDTTDHFLVQGAVIDVDEASINPMLEACYRTRFKGDIDRLYFTFTADPNTSSGDIKMRYQNLEMVVLNKERKQLNHLLTALGNLLMSNKKPDAKGYRYGNISADRDPTKSFFNYCWKSIQSGIKSTLTEKIDKED